MGVLLAVYQKLTLRKRIDRGQYELMMISEKQNQIQRRISDLQQRRNECQNIWDNTLANISGNYDNLFQMGLSGINQNAAQKASVFGEMQAKKAQNPTSVDDAEFAKAQKEAIDAQNKSTEQQMAANMQYQVFQRRLATAKTTMDNMLGNADKNTLRELQQLDSQYSQDKELKEQQLTKWNQEYENVGKLADQEAKNSAPKFGLG